MFCVHVTTLKHDNAPCTLCIYTNKKQPTPLINSGLSEQTLTPMSLGLSHSLSRYKLKFSPDKVSHVVRVFWKKCYETNMAYGQ